MAKSGRIITTRARASGSPRAGPARCQDAVELVDLQPGQLAQDGFDLLFGSEVGPVIFLGMEPVAIGLPVLAHKDQRRVVGRLSRWCHESSAKAAKADGHGM